MAYQIPGRPARYQAGLPDTRAARQTVRWPMISIGSVQTGGTSVGWSRRAWNGIHGKVGEDRKQMTARPDPQNKKNITCGHHLLIEGEGVRSEGLPTEILPISWTGLSVPTYWRGGHRGAVHVWLYPAPLVIPNGGTRIPATALCPGGSRLTRLLHCVLHSKPWIICEMVYGSVWISPSETTQYDSFQGQRGLHTRHLEHMSLKAFQLVVSWKILPTDFLMRKTPPPPAHHLPNILSPPQIHFHLIHLRLRLHGGTQTFWWETQPGMVVIIWNHPAPLPIKPAHAQRVQARGRGQTSDVTYWGCQGCPCLGPDWASSCVLTESGPWTVPSTRVVDVYGTRILVGQPE